MIITKTKLKDCIIIEPKIYSDTRGLFFESYEKRKYATVGIIEPFIQDNFSHSIKGVLRGLHYQKNNPQGKLVSVASGEVFDVAVDIRKNSRTFGHYTSVILSEKNRKQFWIPPGFAHGFCVLSESANFQYKCTNYYYPNDDHCIKWNDPEIGIKWPIDNPILSEKDANALELKDHNI